MSNNIRKLPVLLVLIALFAVACSPTLAALPGEASEVINTVVEDNKLNEQAAAQSVQQSQPVTEPIEPGLLAAYEQTLVNIYEQVNPSVVNIRVIRSALQHSIDDNPGFVKFFGVDVQSNDGDDNLKFILTS